MSKNKNTRRRVSYVDWMAEPLVTLFRGRVTDDDVIVTVKAVGASIIVGIVLTPLCFVATLPLARLLLTYWPLSRLRFA